MKQRISKRGVHRQGIATTELALCLPIVIALMLGVIETCTVIFLKETVTLSAYEGSRAGIQKDGTDQEAVDAVTSFLDSRGIEYDEDNISISSPSFDDAEAMEHVTVTVTVPCEGNTYSGWIFTGRSVSASVTMRKEYQNSE